MICSLDTETTGLLVHRDRLVGFSTTDSMLRTQVEYYNQETKAIMERILGNPRNIVIFFNAPYDLAFCAVEGIEAKCEIHDAQIQAHILNARGKLALKPLAERYLEEDISGSRQMAGWLGYHKARFKRERGRAPHMGDVPWDLFKKYAGDDAIFTIEEHYLFYPQIERNPALLRLYNMERELIPIIVAMKLRGVPLDVPYCRGQIKRLRRANRRLLKKWDPINLGSAKQVRDQVFPSLGVEPVVMTKKGGVPSTAKDVIEDLVAKYPQLQDIIDYRSNQQRASTFFGNLISHSIGGKIYPSFHQTGTKTGRFASSDPNLHNQPRGPVVRRAFTCRPGYANFYYDFKQVELRRKAEYANDLPFIRIFQAGGDPHLDTAREIFGAKRAKEMRFPGKTTNFQVIYGSKAAGLARKLKIPIPEAARYLRAFFRRHPAIRLHSEKVMEEAIRDGMVIDFWGREYHLTSREDVRATPNWQIQGDSATILKRAMIRLYNFLISECPECHMLMTIHDEIPIEIPTDPDLIDDLVPALAETMEEPTKFKIPLPVDITWSMTNWAEKRDWNPETFRKELRDSKKNFRRR